MYYFLSGTDRFCLTERKDFLEKEFFQKFPQGEKFVFDIEENWDENTRARFSAALQSGGLFATPHLVIVRGGEFLDEKEGKLFLDRVEHQPSERMLIMAYFLAPRKKIPAWWNELVKHGTAETCTAGRDMNLRQIIENVSLEYGVKFEPKAVAFLGEIFSENRGRLIQESVKLALESSGVVTLTQVEMSVRPPREQNVFAALDYLTRGDRARAVALFRREETDAEAPFGLLALCAWQLRRLVAIKELAEELGSNAGAIARELKTSPYPIQKTLPLLGRLPLSRLRSGLILLADLDGATKTGRTRPGVALDLFVWKF